jgi:tetratricopeptide (TPR) repeat protein
MSGRRWRSAARMAGALAVLGCAACATRTETHTDLDKQTHSTSVSLVGNRAAALLEQGRQQAARGNFEPAVQLYNEALSSSAAKPEHRAQALLALGQAWSSPLNLQHDTQKAAGYYQRVIAEYPDAPERAEAEKAMAALRPPAGK